MTESAVPVGLSPALDKLVAPHAAAIQDIVSMATASSRALSAAQDIVTLVCDKMRARPSGDAQLPLLFVIDALCKHSTVYATFFSIHIPTLFSAMLPSCSFVGQDSMYRVLVSWQHKCAFPDTLVAQLQQLWSQLLPAGSQERAAAAMEQRHKDRVSNSGSMKRSRPVSEPLHHFRASEILAHKESLASSESLGFDSCVVQEQKRLRPAMATALASANTIPTAVASVVPFQPIVTCNSVAPPASLPPTVYQQQYYPQVQNQHHELHYAHHQQPHVHHLTPLQPIFCPTIQQQPAKTTHAAHTSFLWLQRTVTEPRVTTRPELCSIVSQAHFMLQNPFQFQPDDVKLFCDRLHKELLIALRESHVIQPRSQPQSFVQPGPQRSEQMRSETTACFQLTFDMDLNARHTWIIDNLHCNLSFLCKTCGRRFAEATALSLHLDWHYKLKKRDTVLSKSASRSQCYYWEMDEWVQADDVIFGVQQRRPCQTTTTHVVSASVGTTSESVSERTASLSDMVFVETLGNTRASLPRWACVEFNSSSLSTRSPSELNSSLTTQLVTSIESQPSCPICGDTFAKKWSDEQEEWVNINCLVISAQQVAEFASHLIQLKQQHAIEHPNFIQNPSLFNEAATEQTGRSIAMREKSDAAQLLLHRLERIYQYLFSVNGKILHKDCHTSKFRCAVMMAVGLSVTSTTASAPCT